MVRKEPLKAEQIDGDDGAEPGQDKGVVVIRIRDTNVAAPAGVAETASVEGMKPESAPSTSAPAPRGRRAQLETPSAASRSGSGGSRIAARASVNGEWILTQMEALPGSQRGGAEARGRILAYNSALPESR